MPTSTLNKIIISKEEYRRLKNMERQFQKALKRLEYLMDIREARKEAVKGSLVKQEKLFKKLGI